MIYEIHPTEPGNDAAGFKVWHIMAQEYVLQLRDKQPEGLGMTLIIGMAFNNLKRQDERLADEFMAGVCYGVQHCVMAGAPVIGRIPMPTPLAHDEGDPL